MALHEILHAIGYGASETWDSLKSGTSWTGPEAIAANGGSGIGLVNGGGDHLAPNTMSTTINGGVSQEVVMDPNLTVGTRKYLTELDLAVLRDLGYSTIPEPSSGLLLLCGACFTLRRRR